MTVPLTILQRLTRLNVPLNVHAEILEIIAELVEAGEKATAPDRSRRAKKEKPNLRSRRSRARRKATATPDSNVTGSVTSPHVTVMGVFPPKKKIKPPFPLPLKLTLQWPT